MLALTKSEWEGRDDILTLKWDTWNRKAETKSQVDPTKAVHWLGLNRVFNDASGEYKLWVGCTACHQDALKSGTAGTKWSRFHVWPKQCHDITQHAKQRKHQEAVERVIFGFHKPQSVDLKPHASEMENVKGLPGHETFYSVGTSLHKNLSTSAHIAKDKAMKEAHDIGGAVLSTSVFNNVVNAGGEAARSERRRMLKDSKDIMLTADSCDPYTVTSYCGCQWSTMLPFTGTFGLARNHFRSKTNRHGDFGEKTAHDLMNIAKDENIKMAMLNTIHSFCEANLSTAELRNSTFDETCWLNLKRYTTSMAFDDELKQQQAGRRLVVEEDFANVDLISPDLLHRLRHALVDVPNRETVWANFKHHWCGKLKAHMKQVHYSSRYREVWLASQRFMLDKHGHLGHPSETNVLVETNNSVTRAGRDCVTVQSLLSTMLPSVMSQTLEADLSATLLADIAEETLKEACTSADWFCAGLHMDRMESDRKLLHQVDYNWIGISQFCEKVRAHIDDIRDLIFDAKILKPNNADTFTGRVISVLRTGHLFYFKDQCITLDYKSHDTWAPRVFKTYQDTMRGVVKLLEAIIDDAKTENMVICFNLSLWQKVVELKDADATWQAGRRLEKKLMAMFERLVEFKRQMPQTGLFQTARDFALAKYKMGCPADVTSELKRRFNIDCWRESLWECERKCGVSAMTPFRRVFSFVVAFTQLEASCERSLGKVSSYLTSKKGHEPDLQFLNDALHWIEDGASKDKSDYVNDDGTDTVFTRNAKFVFFKNHGKTFGLRKKARTDKGNKHKQYNCVKRPLKRKLRQAQETALKKLKTDKSDASNSCFDMSLDTFKTDAAAMATRRIGNEAQEHYIDHHLNKGTEGMRQVEEKRRLRMRTKGRALFVDDEPSARSAAAKRGAATRAENKAAEQEQQCRASFAAARRVFPADANLVPTVVKSFVNIVSDILSADVILVDTLAKLDSFQERQSSTDGSVFKFMYFDCLVACLLGLRLATPQYFLEVNTAERIKSDSSIQMRPLVNTKKLYIHATRKFQERHAREYRLLSFIFCKEGTQWKELSDEKSFEAFQKKGQPTLLLDGNGPLHGYVRTHKAVDRIRSSRGRFVKVADQVQCRRHACRLLEVQLQNVANPFLVLHLQMQSNIAPLL